MNLLLIDNDSSILTELQQLAKERGWRTFIAKDATSGLALLDEHPIHAAIIDSTRSNENVDALVSSLSERDITAVVHSGVSDRAGEILSTVYIVKKRESITNLLRYVTKG